MEIKIKKNGNDLVVECNNPKGRHVKKGLKLLLASQSGEGDLKKIDEYMEYMDKITAELTGMKLEELDDLDSDEKEKLVGFYNGKVSDKIDFLMSSLRSGSSEQKGKQT